MFCEKEKRRLIRSRYSCSTWTQ